MFEYILFAPRVNLQSLYSKNSLLNKIAVLKILKSDMNIRPEIDITSIADKEVPRRNFYVSNKKPFAMCAENRYVLKSSIISDHMKSMNHKSSMQVAIV